MTDPTQKQLDLISELEAETGMRFDGNTRHEASVFIDDAIKLSHDLRSAEMESMHGDWGYRD